MHAQKEYGKVSDVKSTPIHNIFALLLLQTSNAFTQGLV